MRQSAFTIISAFGFIALLNSSSSGSETQSQTSRKLPPQIAEYYKAYNFVSSFSSESERKALASYRSVNELPDRLKSKRLEKIYAQLKSIDEQVIKTDPEIESSTLPSNSSIVKRSLMQIIAARRCSNEIVIEVSTYAIPAEANLKLISQNEKDGRDKTPSKDEIVKMTGLHSITLTEIHKWSLFDGQWMKQEADILLLEGNVASAENKKCLVLENTSSSPP